MEPMEPRITKSTHPEAVKARFGTTAELLKRFEVAKAQANLWDGERDGIREAVKVTPPGRYDDVILEKTTSAPVMYPNSDGKHQLQATLQTNVPPIGGGLPVVVLYVDAKTPKELLKLLKSLSHEELEQVCVGHGTTVDNTALYELKSAEKAKVTIL